MLLSESVSNAPQFFYLVPWSFFFPVIGMLINVFLGGKILERGEAGEKIVGWLASLAVLLAFVVAVLQAVSLLGHPEGQVVHLADWISIGALNLTWSFQVDTLSVVMMLVVSGVGALIHIYAIGYMHEDVRHNGDPSRYRRFFVFMNLFIATMMVLVSSNNYLMLFVGWEGVGLCSFLLIGFWYDKGKDGIGNALAAKKAFVTNRIGDFGFLIAAFLMFSTFGSFEFNTIFEQVPAVEVVTPVSLLAITLFMLLGVTGKSAQLPLFVWLPDAMAGPTPVSALIHAATMVTAGVYLVARSAPIYHAVPAAQNWVALVGALTALFAATIAVGQFDIKRVLAYSTISQLGFMVSAVGMGAFVGGMFHLVTHAFFKALLFLSAGSVIQGLERGQHHLVHDPRLKKQVQTKSGQHSLRDFDPQDMRNMGGLRGRMKVTFWVYLIGALALSGIPPLAGFWSKDEILAEASQLNLAAYWMLTAAAFLTAFYMGRQIWMVFFGAARSPAAEHAQESPPLITVPLMILAALSLLGGVLNLPGLHTFTHWVEHTIEFIHEGEFSFLVAGISTGLALLAIGLSWWLYMRRAPELEKLPAAKRPDDPLRAILGPIFTGMNNKWWVDELYWAVILNPYIALSRFLAQVVDWRFWHDWFHDKLLVAGYNLLARVLSVRIDLGGIDALADGIGQFVQRGASAVRRLQTGYVRNYALSIFLGVVLILGYLIISAGR
ncbi:MAG: NADH-quinone oxidoreductase subunit L [Chloroflexota bacterium]